MGMTTPVRHQRGAAMQARPLGWARNPLTEFDQLLSEMSGLIESTVGGATTAVAWTPSADVAESDDAFRVEIELPGVRSQDIDVEANGQELVVTGEIKEKEHKGVLRRSTRRTGATSRSARRVKAPGAVADMRTPGLRTPVRQHGRAGEARQPGLTLALLCFAPTRGAGAPRRMTTTARFRRASRGSEREGPAALLVAVTQCAATSRCGIRVAPGPWAPSQAGRADARTHAHVGPNQPLRLAPARPRRPTARVVGRARGPTAGPEIDRERQLSSGACRSDAGVGLRGGGRARGAVGAGRVTARTCRRRSRVTRHRRYVGGVCGHSGSAGQPTRRVQPCR
ncbi:Hsp20/alpha crystallin family protein [Streptomyces scabiei]|uniref:Hsp20/alpha crystallin family protein n=2 Tax=Streptomyces scabiei TaxID=1930 RepID=UPI000B10F968|nr:Hsp20/alpha crystallin family protein [Streptomyces scabiei]